MVQGLAHKEIDHLSHKQIDHPSQKERDLAQRERDLAQRERDLHLRLEEVEMQHREDLGAVKQENYVLQSKVMSKHTSTDMYTCTYVPISPSLSALQAAD